MSAVIPWIRSIASFPLGLGAIKLFHMLGRALVPVAYGALHSDLERVLSLAVIMGAGTLGSFVVGAVARHRIWLHMAIFFVVMLVIDIRAIEGPFAIQPAWFKALVIGTLPLQAWIGARLAILTFHKSSLGSAI